MFDAVEGDHQRAALGSSIAAPQRQPGRAYPAASRGTVTSETTASRVRPPWLLYLAFPLAFLCGVVVFAVGQSSPTTFYVQVATERLSFETGAVAPRSGWPLRNVLLINGDEPERPFTGTLFLADSVQVTMERVGTGDANFLVQSLRQNSPAGRLLNEFDEPESATAPRLGLRIKNLSGRSALGETHVLPLSGEVVLGRSVGDETLTSSAILRTGRIAVIGSSVFGDDPFEADTRDLEAGSQFKVRDVQGPAVGFVALNEEPAMTAAYRVIGGSGVILRPGGALTPLEVRTSPLQRLIRDPAMQYVSLAIAALLAAAALSTFAIELRRELRDRRNEHAARPRAKETVV